MGNRPQPEERMLFDLAEIRRNYWEEIWENGEMDAGERQGLRVIDNLISFTRETYARRQTAAAIIKGVDIDGYLNRLAAPFGARIVNIADEREARKVVPFPDRDFGA